MTDVRRSSYPWRSSKRQISRIFERDEGRRRTWTERSDNEGLRRRIGRRRLPSRRAIRRCLIVWHAIEFVTGGAGRIRLLDSEARRLSMTMSSRRDSWHEQSTTLREEIDTYSRSHSESAEHFSLPRTSDPEANGGRLAGRRGWWRLFEARRSVAEPPHTPATEDRPGHASATPPHGYRSAVAYDAARRPGSPLAPTVLTSPPTTGATGARSIPTPRCTKRPTPTATGMRCHCPSSSAPTAASAS